MQKITKVTVTDAADQALDQMLAVVNDGFNGGKISKTALASWIINHFKQGSFQSEIETIRKANFDHVAYLLSIVKDLKKAKKEDKEISISEILAPLASQINSSSAQSKRRSKASESKIDSDQDNLESK